jgi:hypothetical protein
MDRYIGLDVHMQSCTMAVMGRRPFRFHPRHPLAPGPFLIPSCPRPTPGTPGPHDHFHLLVEFVDQLQQFVDPSSQAFEDGHHRRQR